MNNTEAKFILNAYRPGGRDAGDAVMAGALAQARSDPTLGVWLAREQAHGAAVVAKLREIVPPAGLREAILMGGRISGGRKPAAPARRAPWARPVWLAAAAAVALLLTVTVALWPKRTTADAPLIDFALVDALDGPNHHGHGDAAGTLQGWLSQPSTRLGNSALPVDFTALRSTGCRTVSIAGRDVLEVCFKRDGAWFHFYVARVEDFPGTPANSGPSFTQGGKVVVAVWTVGAHRFVVASMAGRAAVQRLL